VYDSPYVDSSTQIAGFSNLYPYRVFENVCVPLQPRAQQPRAQQPLPFAPQ
jgi:hypothetical protein